MTRLIDADSLLELIRDDIETTRSVPDFENNEFARAQFIAFTLCEGYVKFAETINAVEVVRCKDCKKWKRNTLIFTDCGICSEDTFGDYEGYLDVETNEDYFCSLGEREEE